MVFAYYSRLTRHQQRVYRQSDGITTVAIPGASDLLPLVAALEEALAAEDRAKTQAAVDRLLTEIAAAGASSTVSTIRPRRPGPPG